MFYEVRKNDLFCMNHSAGKGHLQCSPHIHYHLELVWLYEGPSQACVDSQIYELPEDSVFLAFPNQIHSYQSSHRESYSIMIVNPDIMPEFSHIFDNMIPENPVLENISLRPELRSILERIHVEVEQTADKFTASKLRGLTMALFCELFRHMPLRDRVHGDSGTLKSVLRYCAQNFHQELSLDILSEELHISKYYISHLFGTRFKMKFNDYINSLRASAACRYLSNTEKSITEISELVGFGTSRTFNRAFLKQFGQSPSEYRAQNANFKNIHAESIDKTQKTEKIMLSSDPMRN